MTEDSKHPLDTGEFSSSQRPLKVAKTAEIPSDDKQEEEQESGIGPPQKSMSQNPRIQRYLVAIEYVGTRFSGSQQQLNCRTVMGVLEVFLFIFSFLNSAIADLFRSKKKQKY